MEYGREGKKLQESHNVPEDYPQLAQDKLASKMASTVGALIF